MRPYIQALVIAALLLASGAPAQEQPAVRATHLYASKYLCGGSSETFQEGVVRGMHATSISVHNPSRVRSVNFEKRVSRALPFQRPDTGSQTVVDTLQPMASLDIECHEIRMMLPASMTEQFRSGFLSLVASGELVVVAVYSSRPHGAEVSTLDVETIEGRRVPRGPSTPRPQ